MIAYRFGASFFGARSHGADRPDLAVELVKRGVAAIPDDWRMESILVFSTTGI